MSSLFEFLFIIAVGLVAFLVLIYGFLFLSEVFNTISEAFA